MIRPRLTIRVALAALTLVAPALSAQTPSERGRSVARAPEPTEIELTERVHFDRITMESGLSHTVVHTAHEDRRGFVWFGTADGLNRFDGYQMTVFRHDPLDASTLGGTAVECILEDDDGNFWLAHASTGVTRFDPITETFERYRHDPDDENTLTGDVIFTVFQDPLGRLWFSGPPDVGGLTHFDPETETFTRVEGGPGAPERAYRGGTVWEAVEGDSGRMWLAADFLVEELDPETGQFTHYTAERPERRVSSIVKDADGNVWAGGFRGIYRVDRESKRLVRQDVPVPPIFRMAIDRGGQIWVATDNGLYVVDRAVERVVRHFAHDPRDASALPSPQIRDLLWSRSGLLWISTRHGVGSFHRGQDRFVNLGLPWRESTVVPGARSMSGAPDGSLWIAEGQELARVDLESRTASMYDLGSVLRGPSTSAIHAGSEDDVWLARGERVHRLDVRTRELHTLEIGRRPMGPTDRFPRRGPPTDVVDIVEDNDGTLWFAAVRAGLFFYDRESNRLDSFRPDVPTMPPVVGPDPFHHVSSAHVSRSGMLWLGSQMGDLFTVDTRARRVERHFSPDDYPSLPASQINAIHDDANGDLWLGTQVGLVHVVPTSDSFTLYGHEGLGSPAIESVLEDDAGRLWLGTRKGLVRFDPTTRQFRQFDGDDGLPTSEIVFGAWRSRTGHLAFADAGGFTLFQPRSLSEREYEAPVVLTTFQLWYEPQQPGQDSVLTRPIWETSNVALDYDQNVFGFEFAALDYISPRRNRYRYRLDGFDDTWHEVDSAHRFATYTHVPPGDYTFRVERQGVAGAWQEGGASIRLTVSRPWWMTMWARAGGLLLVFAAVFAWHRARLSLVRKQNILLEEKVASRTAALEDANRRLELAATTDSLTGLPNRRYYVERAELELAKLRRTGRALTIGLADIDDFKQVNDELGHELGDRVLTAVAEVMGDQVRAQDVIARYGGEEFIFLFPETDAAGAKVVAEKIRASVQEMALPANGRNVHVTLTIGLAEVTTPIPVEESVTRADQALYDGKHSGKNCVVVAPPDEDSPSTLVEAAR